MDEADKAANTAKLTPAGDLNANEALDAEDPEERRTHERLSRAWPLLLTTVPGFKDNVGRLQDKADELLDYFSELQRGANCARSDDVNRIKADVANWLNEDYKPIPLLKATDRQNRGLQHDTCGRLLCPIMFDWNNLDVRAKIRESKEGYEINMNYYLRCLYGNITEFNPRRIEQGFLRSKLLVQTYCSIFTSPSSAHNVGEADGDFERAGGSLKSVRATKASVASLLGMDGKVTGRSIAYAAVMLVFNLTDASQWTTMHNNFSFEGLYNFLVDYFEESRSASADARVASLLQWWKSQVFPLHVAVSKDVSQSRQLLLQQDDDY